MTPQQADNLRTLIRHMETKCGRTLNMRVTCLPECGTPACAIGEATAIASLGLSFEKEGDVFLGAMLRHDGRLRYFSDAAYSLFGVTNRLFGAGPDNAFHRNDVTPKEWAVEARLVLSENGYAMDEPKPEPFKAFMARALEPVAVEA